METSTVKQTMENPLIMAQKLLMGLTVQMNKKSMGQQGDNNDDDDSNGDEEDEDNDDDSSSDSQNGTDD